MTLDIQTISTQAGTAVAVPLGVKCMQVLVKNFGANDIWVGIDQEATKTDGMARIPSDTAQVIGSNINSVWPGMTFDTLYVLSDNAETNTVEIQPVQW